MQTLDEVLTVGRVVMNPDYKTHFATEVGPRWQETTKPKMAAAIVTCMPLDTGNMILETEVDAFTDNNGRPSLRVTGKAFYTAYVDQGTGLFGPLAKMITPKEANGVMSWVPNTGKRVFARATRGQPGQHFFARSLEMVFDRVVEHPFGKG